MPWWLWVLGGLVLLAIEAAATGGFFAVFFGLAAILAVAQATAGGIRTVAEAIGAPGGMEAVQLRVAEQYIEQFGQRAKAGNSLVIPTNLADVGSLIATAMSVIRSNDGGGAPGRPPVPASR